MDEFLETLKKKEKELLKLLKESPTYTLWKQVKDTIEVFSKEEEEVEENEEDTEIPENYSVKNLSWRQKVKFAINHLGECSVNDMVDDFFMAAGEDMTRDQLIKRVGVTASKLNTEGEIKCRLEGRKGIYSL